MTYPMKDPTYPVLPILSGLNVLPYYGQNLSLLSDQECG